LWLKQVAAPEQAPDQADVHLTVALKDFNRQWEGSAMRRDTGRGHMPLLEPAGPAVTAAMVPDIMVEKLIPLATIPGLQAAAVPSIYSVAAGADISFTEKDGLASIRLSIKGSRMVAVAPLSLIKDKLDGPAVLGKYCTFLLQATPEQVKTLPPGVFRGTVGEGDLLYVPAGHVVAESLPKGSGSDAMT
jgi:hypothetical protein